MESRLILPGEARSDRKIWSPDGGLHLVRGRGRVLNPDGSVDWEEDWQLNAIANEGEAEILNTYLLASVAVHANLYLALLTGTPVVTTTMASMTETVAATDTGYARQAIANADWGALSGTQPTVTAAATKTFGPNSKGSDWVAITYVALVTTGPTGTAGKFVLFVALSAATTVHNLQSFQYTLSVSAN